jgi:anti-sigma B factor antagonist
MAPVGARPPTAGAVALRVGDARRRVVQVAAFNIRQRERHERYVLICSGELDLQTAGQLEAAITRLCRAGALEIEIDLRDVSFIDSSGLSAVVAAQEQCRDHRAEFFLTTGAQPAVRRVFEITGLEAVFPWRAPTVRDA